MALLHLDAEVGIAQAAQCLGSCLGFAWMEAKKIHIAVSRLQLQCCGFFASRDAPWTLLPRARAGASAGCEL